ncbi:MAG: hypothetical protein ACXWAC_08270 [Usitatibacter sp.]
MKQGVLVVVLAMAAVAFGLAIKQCDGGTPPVSEPSKTVHS